VATKYDIPDANELDIARVIGRHYGDGAVYMTQDEDQATALSRAISEGFVSEDGFLTRKGREFLVRFG
tara:strand:- start:114 stop:317 length:204 start_codon:yes stop_codon:yes gene_type:complete